MPRPRKTKVKPNQSPGVLIGARLKKIRLARGLSQAQLAEKIGVTRETITAYESGRARLLDDVILSLAKALTTSADELLGLKKSDTVSTDAPSVQVARRMQRIKKLPAAEQKAILKNIDMFLKAAEAEQAE
jgi:transcriptional regulator with XRE-family HTH domain